MKYFIPAVFLIIGLAFGYLIGISSKKNDTKQEEVKSLKTSKTNATYYIRDTIVVKEPHKHQTKKHKIITDTLHTDSTVTDTTTIITLDTTVAEYILKDKDSTQQFDTVNIDKTEESLNIKSDRKISTKVLEIQYLSSQKTSTSDSLINQMINVKSIVNKRMIVEFWESPLNYTGYKMSKAKLIVFGLNPHFNYQLYAKNDTYFLNFEQVYYQIEETLEFKKFISVNKSIIFND